jgi:hypothetical protein
MQSGPDDFANEKPDEKRLSTEQFEALLIAIRNGASRTLSEMAYETVTRGDEHDAKVGDVRAVWHAAEIALAVLNDGYVPKQEAVADVEVLVERWAAPES